MDTQSNKVTVIGKVSTEEVLSALHKIGKQIVPWDQIIYIGPTNYISFASWFDNLIELVEKWENSK